MSTLKLGTPHSDLRMSVLEVTPHSKMVEFTISPPSPLSHAMTLYAPEAHVSFEPLSDTCLGDMRVSNSNGDTMFLIKGEQ